MASLDPDRLLDRRRLKRGVAIWRALAIVALVAAILVGLSPFVFDDGERVARLWVNGLIEDSPRRDRLIADLRDSTMRLKAVVLRLDSGVARRSAAKRSISACVPLAEENRRWSPFLGTTA